MSPTLSFPLVRVCTVGVFNCLLMSRALCIVVVVLIFHVCVCGCLRLLFIYLSVYLSIHLSSLCVCVCFFVSVCIFACWSCVHVPVNWLLFGQLTGAVLSISVQSCTSSLELLPPRIFGVVLRVPQPLSSHAEPSAPGYCIEHSIVGAGAAEGGVQARTPRRRPTALAPAANRTALISTR